MAQGQMGAIDEAPVARVDALRAAVLRASPTGWLAWLSTAHANGSLCSCGRKFVHTP